MKIGLWNRLAIVGFVLSVVVGPVWSVIDENNKISNLRYTWYKVCVDLAAQRLPADRPGAEATCSAERFPVPDTLRPGWEYWREAVGLIAVLYAILYMTLWGAVSTARWVWAGRKKRTA